MGGSTEGWRWGRSGRRVAAGLLAGAVATAGLSTGVAGAATATPAPTATPATASADQWLRGHEEFGGGSARSLWLGDVARAIRSDRLPSSADGSVDVSQVIASIDWVVQHRNDPGMNVRVINLSFGTESPQDHLVDPLTHAVESAWRHGIVVVVAAGNSGGALTSPATDPYVLTVGAADLGDPARTTDDKVASFSSVGSNQRRVDLIAPGVSVISSVSADSLAADEHPEAIVSGTYIKGSGTSQAAAVVAGAVANLLSAHPGLTPDQVKGLLTVTATRVPNSPASAQGAGLLNIDLAEAVAPLAGLLPRQNHPRSTGLGSIELARGGNHLLAPDGSDLSGEVDVLGNPWVPEVWAPLASAGAAWVDGTWNGGELTGIGWATTNGEDGAPFTGSTWRGSTWRSDAWSGSTWRGSTWRGSTWRGSTWRGSTWRGSTWQGSDTLDELLADLAAMVAATDVAEVEGESDEAIAAATAAIDALAAQATTEAATTD